MRTLVIDIPGLSNRLTDALLAGAGESVAAWFTELLHAGRATIEPVLPAVTMPAQATYTTGALPQDHGVIANGVAAYRLPELREHLDLSNFETYRCNVSFWEQSNALLTAPRRWQALGKSAALLMVQSSMHGAADVVLTPKPQHTPDGKTISTCWSDPAELYPALREQLGEFPLHHYWGPLAAMPSTEWIAAAARIVWEQHPTDLQWVYIPQLDYDLQRLGPTDPRCAEALAQVLATLTPLVEKARADGARVFMLSEYGMTAVSRTVAPNVLLSDLGLLTIDDAFEVDYARSRAFAMCDHQVAHIYCADDETRRRVREALQEVDAVAYVIGPGVDRAHDGLDSPRAGDLVAFTKPDAWFEYRWWHDFSAAPEWAWTVDIHRKPGYDPTEMFADPRTRRILADQPQLIRGSHGARPNDDADWPVLLGATVQAPMLRATDVADLVIGPPQKS